MSTAVAESPQRVRAVAAASIGNALEWFDFVVYGFFAVTMAKVLLSNRYDTVSLLLALATFGVTFIMRRLRSDRALAPVRRPQQQRPPSRLPSH